MSEIMRNREILVVGDLHGNFTGFLENLKSLEVLDEGGHWSAGNRALVFLGDIIADANPEGLRILLKIQELKAEAKKADGAVIVLAGNHEDFALSFLLGKQVAGGQDVIATCQANNQRGLGLLEFKRFGSTALQQLDFTVPEIWERLLAEREIILENLRVDPKGQMILTALTELQLATRIDDSLFVHTNPTSAMVVELLVFGVEKINQIFQEQLRSTLFQNQPVAPEFLRLTDLALNTENRDNTQSLSFSERLAEIGIRQIFYGHTQQAGQKYSADPKIQSHFRVGELELIPVDFGAFKRDSHALERSIARITTDGHIFTGVGVRMVR